MFEILSSLFLESYDARSQGQDSEKSCIKEAVLGQCFSSSRDQEPLFC